MKILIIAAMQKELTLLLNLIVSPKEVSVEGHRCYIGQVGSHEVIAAKCGIGKVNSALATQLLIKNFQPDLVINSGVAGSVDESMTIGDILVADKVAYHDVWCGPGTLYGEADGCPLFFSPHIMPDQILKNDKSIGNISTGLICSGDKFITSPDEVMVIKHHFPDALGCDMESASIAQTCFKANVPFMIIRIMSDRPGGGKNIEQYENFWEDAPSKTFSIVKSLIEKL